MKLHLNYFGNVMNEDPNEIQEAKDILNNQIFDQIETY